MSTLAFLRKRLDPTAAQAEVARIVARIVSEVNPLEVYIFGSAARGALTDQSDLDLLIVLREEINIKPARKAIAKIRPFSKIPLDIVWMSEATFALKAAMGGLAQVVQEEGKLVYRSEV